NRAAVRMALIFFGLFLAECALFFLVNDGEIFNRAADFINTLSEGSHTRAQRRGVAFTGALICLPLIIVPALTAVVFKNRYIKSEAAKALMPR
ncbi:MAG: hypothetical protein SPD80_04990, partial [Atopobium sp.]|uniref:hypothetical protein n=1 Tax=Atopobium sp. TaxID=1872650 RepID=UPI002A80FF98